MTRNFHRWEVDPFFCAAEEVQDSTDRLESVYRTWLHVKSVADDIGAIEFHKRELSTALGTAKWQLEEFERAVSCVPANDCDQGGDDTPSRHKQFVNALQSQINLIDRNFSSAEDCRDVKTHQQLGEKEKDDLEQFLCGALSSIENHVGNYTTLKAGNLVKADASSRMRFDHKTGTSSHLSVSAFNSDDDFGTPSVDTFLWGRDSSSSDKLLPDLHEIEIRKCSGKRIDGISKPVSDPSPEHFHSDKGELCIERVDGHHRSVSVGSGLSAWKSGSVTDVKGKRQRLISVELPASRLNLWAMLAKVRFTRKSNSGLKRWKDGDANAMDSKMLSLMQDTYDVEQGNENSCMGTKKMLSNSGGLGDLPSADIKHQTTLHDGRQIWQTAHHALPSGRLVQIASAVLVALGLVGLLSFHVTSSSL